MRLEVKGLIIMKIKNEIKRNKCLLTIMVATLSIGALTGCGKSGAFVVDGPDAIITFTENEDGSDIAVGIENPWVIIDKDGVLNATGLNINIPEDAENALYSYLKTDNMAQVTFSYEGHDDWTLRMQKTDMLMDISGLYYEWSYQDSATVSGKEAMMYAYTEGADDSDSIDNMFGVQLINWYDDSTGITYSLSVSGKDLNGMDLQVFAENIFTLEN